MAPTRLTWSPHALDQMRFRGITKTQVREPMATPLSIHPSLASPFRREVTGWAGHPKRRITVIVRPFKTTTRVITAYRTKA
jgi:hypothetical protein